MYYKNYRMIEQVSSFLSPQYFQTIHETYTLIRTISKNYKNHLVFSSPEYLLMAKEITNILSSIFNK